MKNLKNKFIQDNWNKYTIAELCELYNKEFNCNINARSLYTRASRIGCKRTQESTALAISKSKSVPIGTIRFNKYHVCTKIDNKPKKYSANWKRVSTNKYLWELEHGSSIQPDECVILISGTLYKVKQKHHLELIKHHLFNQGEITKAMLEILETQEVIWKLTK